MTNPSADGGEPPVFTVGHNLGVSEVTVRVSGEPAAITPDEMDAALTALDPETVRVEIYKNGMPYQWEQEKTVRVIHMPTGIVESVTDISTHRAKQEALARVEARVRALPREE